MPWGRCDDSFYDHPKVRALRAESGLAACGLYWKAISFSNRHLTDGRLTPDDVTFLGGTTDLADELVRVRLWQRAGRAYTIHDFDRFNDTRDAVLERRAKRAEAGRLGGLASGRTRQANGKQELHGRFKQTEAAGVEPPSRPVPSSSHDSESRPRPSRGGEHGRRGLVRLVPTVAEGRDRRPPEDEERIATLRSKLADPATSSEIRDAVRFQLGAMGVHDVA